MAHLTNEGTLCGLPDGHGGRQHRSELGAARERARKARWAAENPEKAQAARDRWEAKHPARRALTVMRQGAQRRVS